MTAYTRLIRTLPQRVSRDRLEVVETRAEAAVFGLLALQSVEWSTHAVAITWWLTLAGIAAVVVLRVAHDALEAGSA